MGRQAAILSAQGFESELTWPPAPANDPAVLSPEPFGGALRALPRVEPIARGTGRPYKLVAAAVVGSVIAAAAIPTVGWFGMPTSRANFTAAPVTVVAQAPKPAIVQTGMERGGVPASAKFAEGLTALRAQMQAAQAVEPASVTHPDLASADEPGIGWRPDAVRGTAARAPVVTPAPSAAEPAAPQPGLTAAEVSATLQRARGLIGVGDIAAARRLAEYAAVGGDGDALFALAETFDPAQLSRWHVRGVRADTEKARVLYRRALGRGVAKAGERLMHMP